MVRQFALPIFAAALGGCSYDYDVLAVVRDGQLMFTVDPASARQPACLRRVAVTAADDRPLPAGKTAPQAGGDDEFWRGSVGHEDGCANRFPLPYGSILKGRHQDEEQIQARPLKRGMVYDISTTTGATAYGGGRFVIRADGSVENL